MINSIFRNLARLNPLNTLKLLTYCMPNKMDSKTQINELRERVKNVYFM
jgi:hypothetical protein